MKTYLTSSDKATFNIAAEIAQDYKSKGGIIALIGDLGAGKTTFTKGFAKALGIKDNIISPTFVILRQHPIPKSTRTLYHADLYRLEKVNLADLGLAELFLQENDITLIEWADKIESSLPKNSLIIRFEKSGDSQRTLTVT